MSLNGIKILWVVLLVVFFISPVQAKDKTSELEFRVGALEEYTSGFQPTLNKFSDEIKGTLGSYSLNLEANLNKYYLKLRSDLNNKLDTLDNRAVEINVPGEKYKRIETNAGNFLIAVRKIEPMENGYRLTLDIGNINFADYKDYKFKFSWGHRWSGDPSDSRAGWRQSLSAAEFKFQGVLIKGVWNPIKIDLIPADASQIEYIECSLDVGDVVLEYK